MNTPYILWTPDNKEALRLAALEGHPALVAMAARFNVPLGRLRQAIVRFGFVRPKETHLAWGGGKQRKHARWTPELEEQLRAATAVHGGMTSLANATGINIGVLSRHAKRLGVQSRYGKLVEHSRVEHAAGVKTCKRCGAMKPLSNYYFCKSKSSPQNGMCKPCVIAARRDTLRSVLRCTTAVRRGGVSVDTLEAMFEAQSGVCFYTGAYMDFTDRDLTPSADRIDSDLGYVEGNIVLCCFRANIMKNEVPQEVFLRIANLIAKKHPRALPEGVPTNPFKVNGVV